MYLSEIYYKNDNDQGYDLMIGSSRNDLIIDNSLNDLLIVSEIRSNMHNT